jgi:hypothetical protein
MTVITLDFGASNAGFPTSDHKSWLHLILLHLNCVLLPDLRRKVLLERHDPHDYCLLRFYVVFQLLIIEF